MAVARICTYLSMKRCRNIYLILVLSGGIMYFITSFIILKRSRRPVLNNTISCQQPKLYLWHQSILPFVTKIPNIQCKQEKDWVFVDNGFFRISDEAVKKYGNISCDYTPKLRGKDDFKIISGKPILDIKNHSPLPSDFFEVHCKTLNGNTTKYENVHAGISRKQTPNTTQGTRINSNMGLNVIMFGFDSTSRMSWQRNLPRTHQYFVDTLKAVVLKGYNIVGDGTPQALLPILTGKTEYELPEARRGRSKAAPVNGHPWIWKEFKKAGAMTQFGEDCPGIGSFTYRMLGFKEQPVDHYMRPFFMHAERLFGRHKPFCLGSIPRHSAMMNWVTEFFRVYPDQQKFSFLFNSEISHGDVNRLQVVDNDFTDFLKTLDTSGMLNNTVVILMADHGARFDGLRRTLQGKHEERLPYFSFRFPPWFEKKYPIAMKNLRTNVDRLSTPFDIHATFEDMLDYKGELIGDLRNRGISLLREIPRERTCKDADVEPHWCACGTYEDANLTDDNVKGAVAELLKTMNTITYKYRDQCQRLSVLNVSSAVKFKPNAAVLKFKKTTDNDGFIPDLSDKMEVQEILYQITISTTPGKGTFQATVKYNIKGKSYTVNENAISRVNRYGTQPHCVMHEYPHLRPFCYCKVQK